MRAKTIWLAPRTGTKRRAMASDALRVARSVIGRNFMNSPTSPGQNSSGAKAASVVAVEAMIGHDILFAATPVGGALDPQASEVIDLDRVVNHQIRADNWIYECRVLTGSCYSIAHRSQIHYRRHPSEILQHNAARHERKFLA